MQMSKFLGISGTGWLIDFFNLFIADNKIKFRCRIFKFY